MIITDCSHMEVIQMTIEELKKKLDSITGN